jgi:tRNA pseudouridine38-40 synthase
VQGAIEAVVERMTGQQVRVRGAARTDAGVHAEQQLAHVRLASRLDCAALCHGLNALLPPDILIHQAWEVPLEFEARRDNCGKHYRYRIWNGREFPLPHRRTMVQLTRRLDLLAMARGAQHFVGTHDFAAFRAASCDRETTVRTLYRCTISETGPLIAIDIEGTAFLQKMVRIIVGTLLRMGTGGLSLAQLDALLAGGDRSAAGMTMPAHGLTLMRVFPQAAYAPPRRG